jgi:pyruvate dehydrogenase E2 component (dihydrolipoamide acetyltransferase)
MNAPVASPSTRALAREHNIDLASLSSQLGRLEISANDVRQAVKGTMTTQTMKPTAPVDESTWFREGVTSTPVSRLNKAAASNLVHASQTIPTVTHHDRAPLEALEAFRKSLTAEAASKGIKLTTLAFHVKALTRTLMFYPKFNCSLSADGATLFQKHYYDVAIAVDTPEGLMVPVIRDTNRKGIFQIAREIKDLSSRAQQRKVKAEEVGKASMTISNLGALGGRAFSPIVNPPEVAILGITRSEPVPFWDGSAFQPRLMVPLDLSYDHRVINGADAAKFLTTYCQLLADPVSLMI